MVVCVFGDFFGIVIESASRHWGGLRCGHRNRIPTAEAVFGQGGENQEQGYVVDSGELHGGLNLATMVRALKSRRRLAGGEGFLFIREKISANAGFVVLIH